MKAHILRGAAWITASRALINLIGFASSLLLARLLLPEDFGLVAIAATVIAIVSSVTDIPLSAALIQHPDPKRPHFDSAWTLSALRGAAIAALLVLSAIPLAKLYADARLTPLIAAMAGVTLLQSLGNPTIVLFERRLVFHQSFLIGVSKKLAGFAAAALIAWYYQSYWALVVGSAISEFVNIVVSYWLAPYRPRFTLSHIKELLSFSMWLSFIQIVVTINYRLDTLLIGYFLNNADVGQYSYGDNLAALPTREATAPIAQTLFPAFSIVRDDTERLRIAYVRSQTMLCAIALPIGLGFAAIADPLVSLTLGDKWQPAVLVIQVLSSIYAYQALASSLQPLAMAIGKTKALFRRDVSILLIRLPLVLGGLVTGGFVGIVVARIFSGFSTLVMNMCLVKQILDVSLLEQITSNWRALFSSLLMVGFILLFQMSRPEPNNTFEGFIQLGTEITGGGLVYTACSFAAWLIVGQPPGPESEVLTLLDRLISVLKPNITN